MNQRCLLLSLAVISITLVLGCKRNSEPPPPLPVEQMAAEFNKAFGNSPPPVKKLGSEVIAAIEKKDYATAYTAVSDLASAPNLTEDQRLLASRAQLTVNGLLQEAQASGNQEAATVLRIHRENR